MSNSDKIILIASGGLILSGILAAWYSNVVIRKPIILHHMQIVLCAFILIVGIIVTIWSVLDGMVTSLMMLMGVCEIGGSVFKLMELKVKT